MPHGLTVGVLPESLLSSQTDVTYFVDRDPKHFQRILNYMRDGSCVLPHSMEEREELLAEAHHYEVNCPELPSKHFDRIRKAAARSACTWLLHPRQYCSLDMGIRAKLPTCTIQAGSCAACAQTDPSTCMP